jgi:FixJ family two-component response regulator
MNSGAHLATVFVVDDDAAVRDSLALLLGLRGYATAVFACAEDFLRALQPPWRGCVVADIRMPGMSGLDMQIALAAHPSHLPFIIITGHGDIAAARQAIKAKAVDFLEKPFDDEQLVRAIDKALAASQDDMALDDARARCALLSPRERQVLELVVNGVDNQRLGERLGISPRTVEVHKARVMTKTGARNLAELIRIAQARGLIQ